MQTKLITIFATVFLAVLGWIWSVTYTRLTSMEQELVAIKVELVKVQATMIDREEVIRIVRDELKRGVVK